MFSIPKYEDLYDENGRSRNTSKGPVYNTPVYTSTTPSRYEDVYDDSGRQRQTASASASRSAASASASRSAASSSYSQYTPYVPSAQSSSYVPAAAPAASYAQYDQAQQRDASRLTQGYNTPDQTTRNTLSYSLNDADAARARLTQGYNTYDIVTPDYQAQREQARREQARREQEVAEAAAEQARRDQAAAEAAAEAAAAAAEQARKERAAEQARRERARRDQEAADEARRERARRDQAAADQAAADQAAAAAAAAGAQPQAAPANCAARALTIPEARITCATRGGYKKAAFLLHPDKNRGCNAEAVDKFKECSNSKAIYADENKKLGNQYDEASKAAVLAAKQIERNNGDLDAQLAASRNAYYNYLRRVGADPNNNKYINQSGGDNTDYDYKALKYKTKYLELLKDLNMDDNDVTEVQ
jgi:hypothetical protein